MFNYRRIKINTNLNWAYRFNMFLKFTLSHTWFILVLEYFTILFIMLVFLRKYVLIQGINTKSKVVFYMTAMTSRIGTLFPFLFCNILCIIFPPIYKKQNNKIRHVFLLNQTGLEIIRNNCFKIINNQSFSQFKKKLSSFITGSI